MNFVRGPFLNLDVLEATCVGYIAGVIAFAALAYISDNYYRVSLDCCYVTAVLVYFVASLSLLRYKKYRGVVSD